MIEWELSIGRWTTTDKDLDRLWLDFTRTFDWKKLPEGTTVVLEKRETDPER